MLTQFLVEVSRKPPSTAQPKPKNISWACHCTEVNGASGGGRLPLNISAHAMGKTMPDKQARAKKGRKPTSQNGCVCGSMAKRGAKCANEVASLATVGEWELDLSRADQAW